MNNKILSVSTLLLTVICWLNITQLQAQNIIDGKAFIPKQDSSLFSYDVTHYDLHIKIDIENQSITGKNTIAFKKVSKSNRIELSLFETYKIDSTVYHNTSCTIERQGDRFWVNLPKKIKNEQIDSVSIFYHGKLTIAEKAPWEGGFVFNKDQNGDPFIGVACEEIGASSWWPTKELYSDKCDSADLYFEVPNSLQAIANGKLVETINNNENVIYHWKVTYPINNYNISVTVGNFAHFSDIFKYEGKSYKLDYYVLKENLKKAKQQFKQVKPMLKIYQQLYGEYPFPNDGYKLIEAPYLGMEHQSGIAYGNGYQNGYEGKFFAPISKKFDFIIIHESGHEYWGNSVTMDDLCDMWIHEAFCTYTELLYVEKHFGKKYSDDYVNYWRQVVSNQSPIVPERHSNIQPPTDIYYKGALLLHTIRKTLNNDRIFIQCLKAIQTKFKYKTVDTPTLTHFMNQDLKMDFSKIFEQYLFQTNPPILNFTLTPNKDGKGYIFKYKWDGTVDGFSMPITIKINNRYHKVLVNNQWSETIFHIKALRDYEIEMKDGYFMVKYE